jgi:hypothetical protein
MIDYLSHYCVDRIERSMGVSILCPTGAAKIWGGRPWVCPTCHTRDASALVLNNNGIGFHHACHGDSISDEPAPVGECSGRRVPGLGVLARC